MVDDRRTPERALSPETLAAARFADLAASLGDAILGVVAQFHELALVGATEIEQASRAADHAAVRSAAHRMKGSSMALGVERLRDVCAAIEQAAGAGSQIPGDAVAALRREIAAAHDAMLGAAPVARSAGQGGVERDDELVVRGGLGEDPADPEIERT